MKKVILLLFALVSFSSMQSQTVKQPAAVPKEEQVAVNPLKFTARVVKISDGDTYKVESFENKKTYIIRLAGVDAPERRQDFGMESKNFVGKLFYECDFVVTVEIIAKNIYGNYIAWIYYGKETNINLSEQLIQNGYAWHQKEFDNSDVLQKMEDKAREAKIGLWKSENPIYPSDFRKTKKRI